MSASDVRRRASFGRLRARWERDGERLAIYGLCWFLGLWLASMVIWQFALVIQNDGLGVSKQHRVPQELVDRAGVGNDYDKIMDKTNRPKP